MADTSQAPPVRRWPRLSEETRKTVAAVLFDKILLTVILTVGTYALQKYIDARSVQQEMLRSSLAAVTAIRSEFLKEQRNALAANMMDALSRIDASRAIDAGGLSLREDVVAVLGEVSRKLTLLTSMVVAANIATIDAEQTAVSPMQRAVSGLQQTQLQLDVAIEAFEDAIEAALLAHPEINNRWSGPRVISSESIMALVGAVSSGQGQVTDAYTRVLAAVDAVLIEQVRLDVSAALELASTDGRQVALPQPSSR
ncbi:MAG: hypothetical protein M3453_17805 [Pseudomonadota bacterium]|nr:hypothetical protein [Pseudomonadota bacterium]